MAAATDKELLDRYNAAADRLKAGAKNSSSSPKQSRQTLEVEFGKAAKNLMLRGLMYKIKQKYR